MLLIIPCPTIPQTLITFLWCTSSPTSLYSYLYLFILDCLASLFFFNIIQTICHFLFYAFVTSKHPFIYSFIIVSNHTSLLYYSHFCDFHLCFLILSCRPTFQFLPNSNITCNIYYLK